MIPGGRPFPLIPVSSTELAQGDELGQLHPTTRPPLRNLSSWKRGAGVCRSLSQDFWIPASGELCKTPVYLLEEAAFSVIPVIPVSLPRTPIRGRESKALLPRHRSLADSVLDSCFRRNDGEGNSCEMTLWVIQRSPCAGMGEEALECLPHIKYGTIPHLIWGWGNHRPTSSTWALSCSH